MMCGFLVFDCQMMRKKKIWNRFVYVRPGFQELIAV
jgi:hypothetical protein